MRRVAVKLNSDEVIVRDDHRPLAVVGLDLSLTSTGVACPTHTATLKPGTRKGAPRLRWIREQVLEHARGAALVVIENYAFSKGFQAHQLGELGGVIRVALYERQIPFVVVRPEVVKGYATGALGAPKEAVLAAAIRRLGYEGSSTDEADALWCRAVGCAAMGEPVADLPEAHRRVLAEVNLDDVPHLRILR